MYLPSHFAEHDTGALHALIEAHPLATWIAVRPTGGAADGTDGAGVEVNHVPFRLDRGRGPHGTLVGHVARANPVWQHAGPSVFVFHGPQAYVTPGWYPGKAVHGKVVPTWNYAVVHAHGRPRAVTDPAALHAIVATLTDRHEAARPAPWRVDDAPPDFVAQMLGAIVGIEVEIERLEGKVRRGPRVRRPERPAAAQRVPPPARRRAR
ncbi:FMN-binding negative transcriptional regulator [Piscinibacter sakaiensis]|uniref:FMN-binding negative transcriptional regulator n=1 Tax=Piscinibacter sakaiensis TaxID=1547922 RepID=UPI0037281062